MKHPGEILFHIKLLQNHESSFVIKFSESVVRYPACLGIDEQEINKGTFPHDGKLYGLKQTMDASDIRKVGLANFAKYISPQNPFNSSVMEFRLHDFAGLFSSNVYTSFESTSLKSHHIAEKVDYIVDYASTCQNCLFHNLQCEYDRIDQKCERCEENGDICVSLITPQVLWDMGTSQKKMEKDTQLLEKESTEREMLSRRKYSYWLWWSAHREGIS